MPDEEPFEERLTHQGSSGTFRRILVGYDGSPGARRALQVAVALGAELSGEVKILMVLRPPAHAEGPEEHARAIEAEKVNLSRGLTDIQFPGAGESEATEFVTADDPAGAIGAHAEEHGFDLVVVGGHGRERITHRGIGQSVAALLRHHPCPVLVV